MFYKFAIFLTAIRFSENLNVRAIKCDYKGKHQKSRSKRRFIDVFFYKLCIFLFVSELSDIFTVRA